MAANAKNVELTEAFIEAFVVFFKPSQTCKMELFVKGELHSNSWNLTFVKKLQFPLILWSFVSKASKNW